MSKLYLLPNSLADEGHCPPHYIAEAIREVRVFFVEGPKAARRLLKSLDPNFPLAESRFLDLNEHTGSKEVQGYLNVIKDNDAAVISESGCPCVADPGGDLVLLAHQNQIEVCPLVGPSSIILALMASGLNGQNFAFNGYLPKEAPERLKKIEALEDRSFKEKQTQIFMETPYRNISLLKDVLSTAHDQTLLCIASDLTGPHQNIKTMSIRDWKKNPADPAKKPALFLLQKI